MTIADKLSLLANTKEQLRIALGMQKDAPFSDYVKSTLIKYSPVTLFYSGQKGALYEPSDLTTLFQDAAGAVPVTTSGDPVGKVVDKSGNNIAATQSISAARPVYNNTPSSLVLDKVDDALIINVPTGGWIGTMVLASANGTASYGVNIPAGNFTLGGKYFSTTKLVGAVFRHGAMTTKEKESVESYFEGKGAVRSFAGVTDFSNFWRNKTEITSIPLIDTSSATNFFLILNNCSSLTSIPAFNTVNLTNLYAAVEGCSSITSFPLLNVAKVNDFSYTWKDCTLLANFPPNFFNSAISGKLLQAFTNTALTQVSIDNILTSLVTSGITTGTRVFNQSGGSAPSATGNTAINTLRSRGWTVTVTGGY